MNKSLGILAVIATLWTAPACWSAETPGPSEYQVKAAILCNLAKYVDWQPASFSQTNSPLVVGVLGEDNFGDDLRRMMQDKTINGRRLFLKRLTSGEDLKSAHVLFISTSDKKRLTDILEKLRDTSVLTVGESDSFTQLGGIINLATKDHRIRQEVNLAAAERAHLKISSKLLNISDVVQCKPGEKTN